MKEVQRLDIVSVRSDAVRGDLGNGYWQGRSHLSFLCMGCLVDHKHLMVRHVSLRNPMVI